MPCDVARYPISVCMANNEFLITDIVDKKAFDELTRLQSQLSTTTALYVAFTQEIAKASSTNPKTFDELTSKARNYEASLEKLNKTGSEMSSIQSKQLTILKQVATQLNSMSSLNKLNTLMEQFAKNVQAASDVLGRLASTAGQAAATQQGAAQATQEATATMAQASQQLNQAEINYENLTRTIIGYNSEVTELASANARHRVELDSVSASMKQLEKDFKSGKISVDDYSSQMGELKLQYEQLKASINQNNALIRNHATAIVSTSGSYYEMNAAMLELQKRYKALSDADRNSPIGQNLVKQANEINKKLKEIDAQFGNYQRNVGNYASHWNGLGMSIQQIGRELPSLAMGWNTFFLAISNNLPMLTDELARARNEYNELKKSGQAATPVWKQVVSSLLSWQTALTVGITLLSVYGKDIIEWVGNLFKANKVVLEAVDLQKELNTVRAEGEKKAQDEIVTLRLLYNASQDESRSMNERIKAVDELQKKYPSYFSNMSDEEVLAGKASSAYTRLAQSIVASAMARAARDRMVQEQSKIIDNELKITEATERLNKANEEYQGALRLQENVSRVATSQESNFLAANVKRAKNEVEEITNEITRYNNEIANAKSITKELEGKIGIEDLLSDSGGGDGTKEYADYIKKVLEDLNKSRIDLMEEGRAKEIAQIQSDYDARIKEITGNTEQEIELRKNLEELKERAIQEVNEKYDKKLLDIEKANLQNRLAAIGESSQKELDERLKIQLELNDMEKQAEISAAKETGEDIAAISEKYEKMKNDIVLRNLQERIGIIEHGTDMELQQQELESLQKKEALTKQYRDGLINRTEYERGLYEVTNKYARMRLQTLIDEVKSELALGGMSESQQKELEARITKLQQQLNNVGKGLSAPDVRGINEFEQAIQQMQQTAEDSLGDTAYLFKPLQRYMSGIAETAKRMGKDINEISFDDFWNNLDPSERASFILQGFSDISRGISSIMSDIMDARIESLEEEQEANQEAYDAEVERIESLQETGAISTEEAEARKRAAEDRTKAKEEQIAKKKAELEQKQARWDKANSIIQAGIATALAVTKALPNLVLAALVGAMGAAQIAVIASKQIPKYAGGTEDHPGGLAVVGDGGRREAVLTDKGVYVTPDRATLVNLPKHAQVIPDLSLLSSRKGLTSDYGLLERMLNERRGEGVVVNVNGGNYGPLENRMDENTRQLREIRRYLRGRARDIDFRRISSRL